MQMGMEANKTEVDRIFHELDHDGGGSIDFDEFVKVWSKGHCLCYTAELLLNPTFS